MASKNIKGITIVIDGDTTALGNALKDLNSDLKLVDKDLRNVDQALKLDPGNAEQVARKMELLSEKSEIAEKKVEALKLAQKQMDAQGVDKNSKAYQDLVTEIAKAESQQKNLSVQMERTEASFKEVTQGSKQLGTYLKATGQTADDLTSILGSKLVDAYKSGSLGAAGYQVALEKVCQQTTGSKKDFEEFKRILDSVDDDADFSRINQELESLSSKASSSKSDVSSLGSEFDNLNSKTNSITQELKLVNEALKLDPSNVDLVTQKHDLLSEAVKVSEEKLTALRRRYDEFKDGKIELGEEEFRQLQREIVNTENSLGKYKSQLSDLQNAQQRLNTYFEATGTTAKDFANVLGNELVNKIERGEASSEELARAIDKIGKSANDSKGDIGRFKSELDDIKDSGDLDKLSTEFRNAGKSADEAEDSVESFADKLDQLNKSVQNSNLMDLNEALEPISDALMDVGSSALEASETVTDSFNKIKIGLGTTEEETQKFADIAMEVFRNNFGDSLDDVTERTVYFAQVMGDLVDEADISDLVSQFITLDEVGMDYNETVRGVKNLMVSFGISAQEATDLMTTGMQNGLNFTEELGDNIAEYSPRWAEAGVSATQYFSLLEAGCQAGGYQLDKVGDFLNEFITSLQDGRIEENIGNFTQSTQDLFQAWKDGDADTMDVFNSIIGELRDMDDQTQAATLSGQIWSALGEDNAQGMIQALADVPDSYQNIAGAAQTAADNNSNSAGQMERSWTTFKMALAPVGDKIAEIASKILELLTPVIDFLSNAFSSLPGPIQTFIVAFGGIMAVVVPLVGVIGGLIAAFTAISGVLTTVIGVGLAPIIGVVAAVAAAIAALIAIITNWGAITEWFGGVWDSICSTVSSVWDGLCSWLGDAWTNCWDGITGFFSGLGEKISGGLSGIGSFIGNAWDGIKDTASKAWNGISSTVGGIWNTMKNNAKNNFENLKTVVGNVWDGVKGTASNVWNGISSTVGGIWDTMKTNAQNNFNNLKTVIGNVWDGISSTASTIWEGVSSTVGGIWDTMKTNAQNNFENVKTVISNVWDNVSSTASTMWEGISSTVGGVWDTMKTNAQNNFDNLKTVISNVWDSVSSTASSVWEGISSTVGGIWDTMKNNAKNNFENVKTVVSNVWDNLKSNSSTVWNNISTTVGGIWDKMKSNAKTNFENVKTVVSNVWDNLKSNSSTVWNNISTTVGGIWDKMKNNAKTNFENTKTVISNVWDSVKQNTSSIWDNIKNSTSNTVSGMFNSIKNTLSNIPNTFRNIWDNAKNIVSNAVNALKNMMNFHWELPKIKLPHFSISGQFSLMPPSIPTISVSWYKKGGILTAPTIFGANGSTLLGGGEAGAEAVMPIDLLKDWIRDEVTSSNEDIIKELKNSIEVQLKLLEAFNNQNTQIVLDNGALVGQLTPKINESLGREYNRKRRL